MTKVNLIEARKPTKADPARTCYVLRWWTAADKYRAVTLGVVGTMTKRQAVLRQRRKQGEFDNDLAPTDRPGVQPLKAFFEADREAVAVTVAPKTLEDLRIAADHAVRALGEDFDLHKMGHAHIGRIATAMDKRGLARATWVKVLSKLQAACSRGVKRGDLKANPFVGYRYPKVPRRKVDTFSAVEVAAMIGAAPSLWWRVLIRLAYTTGLRRGEMLNLQWDDIDFAGGVVKVQAKRAGVTTICGRLLPTTLAWESKSHNNRQVPVPAATLEALADLRDYSAMTDHDGQRPPQTAYVFISLRRMATIGRYMEAHSGRLSPSYVLVTNMRREFTKIQLSIRMDNLSRVTRSLHDLRRSYGTAQAAAGVPMPELCKLMGHSSWTTTKDYYVGSVPGVAEMAREAVALPG